MPTLEEQYALRKVDGLASIVKLGKAICRITQAFSPIIKAKYPESPNILALLTAIDAVCALLPDAQAEMNADTGDNTDIAGEADIAGTNPSAPDPVYPE